MATAIGRTESAINLFCSTLFRPLALFCQMPEIHTQLPAYPAADLPTDLATAFAPAIGTF